MSLVLKFTITLGTDCKSFIFTDTSGTYNVSTNPTGWGAPNLQLNNVNTAKLSIQNLTTLTTYDDVDVTPSDSDGTTLITTQDLKVAGISIGDVTLPDGQYCFVYTVVSKSTQTYQQTLKKVFLCESCCKIKTKACEIDLECGCCNEPCADEIWKFLQAWTEFKVIEYSAYCSSQSNINNKIKSLQSFLTSFDCKNCN